jgi:hypothetical protein
MMVIQQDINGENEMKEFKRNWETALDEGV